jgi:LuxR family maltose regulon positive regulatory protein
MQSEGQLDALEAHLASLEQTVAAIDDAAERDILKGRIAAHRANRLMSVAFRPAATMAQEALTLLPEHERFHRGVAYLILGNAGRYLGDVGTAQPALEQAATICQKGGDMIGAVVAAHALAQLYESQGKLHEAARLLAETLPWATVRGQTLSFGGILHIGLARVHYQWNELSEAMRNLDTGLALMETASYRHEMLLGYLTLARIRLAQGDGDDAWKAIRTGEEYCSNAGIGRNPHLERFKANLHLIEGNLRAADHWAGNHELAAPGENQPMHLAEQILLARIYLAQGRTGAAATLLEEQREAGVRDKRAGDLIAILAALALVRARQGADTQALVTLEEALHLGDSGRFVRLFVDYGKPMAQLLRTAAAAGIALDYVTHLLAAFAAAEETGPEAEELVDPLSERELEVLRLIAAGLTNREIAEQLVIAQGTAKRHVSNIYGKLGVGSRTQAVARGRELHLL